MEQRLVLELFELFGKFNYHLSASGGSGYDIRTYVFKKNGNNTNIVHVDVKEK